jgi:hypothetical protein
MRRSSDLLILHLLFNTLPTHYQGSLLCVADPQSTGFSLCIYACGAAAVVGVCLPSRATSKSILGPYARHRDVGILGYTFSCCICVALGLSLSDIAPLFYADPAGAIVGRSMSKSGVSNPKLFGTSKTLAGSVAVALVAFCSTFLGQQQYFTARLMQSFYVAAIELFGGEFDNPLIGIFLICYAAVRASNEPVAL